jgi:hypothetical protein
MQVRPFIGLRGAWHELRDRLQAFCFFVIGHRQFPFSRRKGAADSDKRGSVVEHWRGTPPLAFGKGLAKVSPVLMGHSLIR